METKQMKRQKCVTPTRPRFMSVSLVWHRWFTFYKMWTGNSSVWFLTWTRSPPPTRIHKNTPRFPLYSFTYTAARAFISTITRPWAHGGWWGDFAKTPKDTSTCGRAEDQITNPPIRSPCGFIPTINNCDLDFLNFIQCWFSVVVLHLWTVENEHKYFPIH